MKASRHLAAILVAATILPSAFAQKIDKSKSSIAPRFSSRTELVLVPVVVRNHGRPVTGLNKQQFTLRDEGKLVNVAVFEEVKTSNKTPDVPKQAASAFRNYVPGNQVARRVSIILLDLLNTPFTEQNRVRDGLANYLSGMSPDEPTAVLILNRKGLVQVQSFGTNPQILIDAIKRTKGVMAPQAGVSSDPVSSAAISTPSPAVRIEVDLPGDQKYRVLQPQPNIGELKDELQLPEREVARMRQDAVVLDTLHAFEQIAQGFGGIPGRKSLLWMTYGYPYTFVRPNPRDGSEFSNMVDDILEYHSRIFKLLQDSNVAVYPVDVMGLPTPNDIVGGLPLLTTGGLIAGIGDPRDGGGGRTALKLNSGDEYHDTLKAFADGTGGKPCLNNNETTECLKRAARDSESYYMLGFYVKARERKPGWHRLSVKVQSPHDEIRYRQNFLVTDFAAEEKDAKSPDTWINWGSRSPVDYTNVQFDASLKGVETVGSERKLDYVVSLPPGAFAIDEDDQNFSDVSVCAVVLDENMKYVTAHMKRLSGHLNADTASRLQKLGLDHVDSVNVAPGRYQVKFIVRDNLTAKMGSVTVPLEIK